ncbi:MAG: hypothetical protein LBS62_06810 [Clostridiales bacterium]|nr:hypothetical protein [Clostridiales bacterium]
MAEGKQSNNEMTRWHEVCYSGLRHEFFSSNDIEYLSEFRLSKEPLRIDLLLKKNSDEPVEKNIGRIFRKYNIIEYKSPKDYISVNAFYKAFGYAGLFSAFEDVDPRQVTITFISKSYPRALMKYLKEEKGVEIEKPFEGGYYIKGYPFPIQIIVGAELDPEENIWLASLCRELTPVQLIKLKSEAEKLDLSIDDYYMSVILNVNKRIVEELISMARADIKHEFPELYSILVTWAKGSDEFIELQRQAEEARRAKEDAIIILKQQNIPDDLLAAAFNTSEDEISRLALR